MTQQWNIEPGMKVRSSEGDHLGKVIECSPETFVIERGLFFPKEYVAYVDNVREIREGEVWLATTRAELEGEHERESPPAAAKSFGLRDDTTSMPLVEEKLDVSKHTEQVGEVNVRKETVTETQQLNVPVTREEVVIETVAASGARTGDDVGVGKNETLRVPIREERVDITKTPEVTGEVRVTKTAREDSENVVADVKKEKPIVEKRGSVGFDADEEARRAQH